MQNKHTATATEKRTVVFELCVVTAVFRLVVFARGTVSSVDPVFPVPVYIKNSVIRLYNCVIQLAV